jgi:deoxyribodipyrimidine photo-lyase
VGAGVTDIYWFQHDLRVRDNPGLLQHAKAEKLLLVYFWPESRPWCNVTGMGQQRRRFLLESLAALREDLAALGQSLLVLTGRPQVELPRLTREIGARRLGTSLAPGYYERRARGQVAAVLPIPLQVYGGNTLFSADQLPFALEDMPPQFTTFKNRLGSVTPTKPLPAPSELPPPPPGLELPALELPLSLPHIAFPVRGGSRAGHRRLQQWVFGEQAILNYKHTRNGLDGLDGSSSLSPWLALGSLSPREVAAEIARFEAEVTANESTHWLLYEMLWREFFHWRALRDDISLFRAGGAPGKLRRCTFEPRNFARWCQGDTNFPLVNALMHQLVETGWMSNRGRQIAASCLVNEYGIDWRYGAAFFEKHLLDYDVASNYGNWQYLAGVGADPRGGRHFNIEKQSEQYDPSQLFTKKWDGFRPPQPEYVTDAADWPLSVWPG